MVDLFESRYPARSVDAPQNRMNGVRPDHWRVDDGSAFDACRLHHAVKGLIERQNRQRCDGAYAYRAPSDDAIRNSTIFLCRKASLRRVRWPSKRSPSPALPRSSRIFSDAESTEQCAPTATAFASFASAATSPSALTTCVNFVRTHSGNTPAPQNHTLFAGSCPCRMRRSLTG